MNADLVVRGGRIFTADPARPFVEALAIQGSRIVAVGDDADATVGSRTEVIDLAGRMLTPGFIDAHVHPGTSGLDKLRVDFDDADDAATAIEVISRYSADHPDLPWIIGSGWSQEWFPRGCPDREALDRVVSARPVLIWNADGHGAWANSAALRLAGLDATTPDPPDGRIERNLDGSPQGTLHEGAARLVERHAPADTVEDFEMGLLRGQEELLSLGITGWQDAIVVPHLQQAYLNLATSGRLKGRVVGALWWERGRGMEQVEEMVDRRSDGAERFSPTSVKLMLDGVAENFTASVLEPWLDDEGRPTDNYGIDFIDPGELAEIVTRLDSRGFQCHFHAIGDRAVRNALDAIEAARRRNGPSDHRHHVAHIQIVHPDDIPRFAALDVVANAQPLWACHDLPQDVLTIPFLGPVRSGWQYPFASLARSGARLAMGSDWSVSTADVMEQVEMAVTRVSEPHPPFLPEERLTPEQALTAFTAGSAFVNHADGETGRIAPGMLADLVLLDRDPISGGTFKGVEVELTMIGGEVVFGAPA